MHHYVVIVVLISCVALKYNMSSHQQLYIRLYVAIHANTSRDIFGHSCTMHFNSQIVLPTTFVLFRSFAQFFALYIACDVPLVSLSNFTYICAVLAATIVSPYAFILSIGIYYRSKLSRYFNKIYREKGKETPTYRTIQINFIPPVFKCMQKQLPL